MEARGMFTLPLGPELFIAVINTYRDKKMEEEKNEFLLQIVKTSYSFVSVLQAMEEK
jgi:hypothetical protein